MDAENFKKVFLPYHQKLYRIAYQIVKEISIAEDIIQEIYIKLWNKRYELDGIENPEAFAISITKNQSLDYLRKAKNSRLDDREYNISSTDSLVANIESHNEADYLKYLVHKLPEQQRQVMLLKHWEDYSDEEIEEITGLTSGNIRVILSRARKIIREQFKKERIG